MWAYIVRKLLANVPVYFSIVLFVMIVLRLGPDPVNAYLGKHADEQQKQLLSEQMGLERSFATQYFELVGNVFTLDFSERSWEQKRPVGEMVREAIPPSLAIMVPSVFLTSLISIAISLLSAFYRGSRIDRFLVMCAVMGMCVSYLVYIIFGQYFGAYRLNEALGHELFAIEGYEPGIPAWVHFCMLPVMINILVAMGYDTRFYRAVMVEEISKDYITTARAKGATKRKIMFVHMLKNAMIPIVTRVMITVPFLVTGSLLVEMYFNIPGMGRTLITAIRSYDFPVIQSFTAMFAALFIVTNILTDVLYAVVDPRVRLS